MSKTRFLLGRNKKIFLEKKSARIIKEIDKSLKFFEPLIWMIQFNFQIFWTSFEVFKTSREIKNSQVKKNTFLMIVFSKSYSVKYKWRYMALLWRCKKFEKIQNQKRVISNQKIKEKFQNQNLFFSDEKINKITI